MNMTPETMTMLHSVIEAEPEPPAALTYISERIDIDDSLSWPIDLITTVQSRDATSQIYPSEEPETTGMPTRVSTEIGLADISDSSGRVDFNDYLPLPVFSDFLFWTTTVPSQDDQARMSSRVLIETGLADIIDSSGSISVYDYLSWPTTVQSQDDQARMSSRVSTETGLADIIDSSGTISVYDFLSWPSTVQSQDDQSKGLSEGTILKYLKTTSADEIRDKDIDGDRKICAVCLDDICGQRDKVAILDECRHEFHYCCLEKWLRRKNVCPLCRRTAIFFRKIR